MRSSLNPGSAWRRCLKYVLSRPWSLLLTKWSTSHHYACLTWSRRLTHRLTWKNSQVDIEKLARLTGYENPRSVSNVLGVSALPCKSSVSFLLCNLFCFSLFRKEPSTPLPPSYDPRLWHFWIARRSQLAAVMLLDTHGAARNDWENHQLTLVCRPSRRRSRLEP